MGILKDKVKEAFEMYKAGNFRGFVKGISDVSDVRWQNHKDIVDSEIDRQLTALNQKQGY